MISVVSSIQPSHCSINLVYLNTYFSTLHSAEKKEAYLRQVDKDNEDVDKEYVANLDCLDWQMQAPRKAASSTAVSRKRPATKEMSKSKAPRVSVSTPWRCKECTYQNLINISEKTLCEMCSTPRPRNKEARK